VLKFVQIYRTNLRLKAKLLGISPSALSLPFQRLSFSAMCYKTDIHTGCTHIGVGFCTVLLEGALVNVNVLMKPCGLFLRWLYYRINTRNAGGVLAL